MEITKSKYTAEQLEKCYEIMEEKTDYSLFDKVHFISNLIAEIPYLFWFLFLAFSIFAFKPVYSFLSILFAVIGAVAQFFKRRIAFLLINRYWKKGKYFFNILDITLLPEFIKNITCSEKLSELKGNGALSLLKKGDAQIILHTDKNGNEELYPLAHEISVTENILDFSCHDEDIDKILARHNLTLEEIT